MFVKNRDGPSFSILFSFISKEQAQPVAYCARRTRAFRAARSASTRDGWGLPSPIFLTVAGGPC